MQILLIDDHTIFRDGLKLVLQGLQDNLVFFEASTCFEAMNSISSNKFDLILLDLNLPDSVGYETLSAFRLKFEDSPIVILSGEDSPHVIREAIDHGAAGFIPKSSGAKVLTSALQLVINGGVYLPPNSLDGMATRVNGVETLNDTDGSGTPVLSGRQREVLANAVKGKANKVIAREMDIAESTVKAHLSNAYRALGVTNRTEAVYAASKLGIVAK